MFGKTSYTTAHGTTVYVIQYGGTSEYVEADQYPIPTYVQIKDVRMENWTLKFHSPYSIVAKDVEIPLMPGSRPIVHLV